MAFDGLSDRLDAAFRKLKSKGSLSESDVKSAMREVRMALLEADVNFKVARDFTTRVTEQAVGEKVMESLTPSQMVIKIVNRELVALMGGTRTRLASAPNPPTVILLCGLQGSGKTTHCAKLALMLKNQGHRPLLTACDIYRPAAIEQLKILGKQIDVPVYEQGTNPPAQTAKEAITLAKNQGYDYVLLDTAGRLHIDEVLMNELSEIKSSARPTEILLVVDAMTGQDAVAVAEGFNNTLGVDGVILTKTDGDTRGGAVLSVLAVTGKPVKFMGVGEKLGDLDTFHPDRMASRILGMGDVLSLIEKAESNLDEKTAAELEEKLRKNKFDLNDLLEQFRQIKKMGNIKDMLAMIPGLGKQVRDVDVDESQFDKMQAIILSMTPKERSNPEVINGSRKKRIAAGCGRPVEDVNKLLAQYKQMKKMFSQFGGKGGKKRMRGMMGPGGFPF